jgi:spermidine/putrescine transport system substrate-binding protein
MVDRDPEGPEPAALDPSIWRGLTQRRLSRRDLLRYAGAGAGALGISALLEACGVKGTPTQPSGSAASNLPNANIGTAAWWSKQSLTHQVNFANWPYYIDVFKGHHPTLDHFTEQTGIQVNYTEPINDNIPFYTKIRPSLQAKQYTGYDIIVMTNNSPALGYLMQFGWLTPLDRSAMPNFNANAGPLVKSPAWDPGNKYTMAWQSGWTAMAYNSSVVTGPIDSVLALFDPKYSGKIGMPADPQELGSIGLLAIGVEPAKSTPADWQKAAQKLQQQKPLVRKYYDQDYITALKNGDTVISWCWSGDIFQANLNSKYKDLKLVFAKEGAMFWTDNMCIPLYAQSPKDAMMLMDYYYDPTIQAVVEYYNDYVCPVPAAKDVLLHPTGWAAQTLQQMQPSIGLPPSVTADAPTVFPDAQIESLSRPYYQYKNQDELDQWNNLFVPITEG